MDEVLKKIFESEFLNEETRKELETAINEAIEAAKEAAAKEAAAEAEKQTKLALIKEWNEEKEAIINAVDSLVQDTLEEQLKNFETDIKRFRDLEVEYAHRFTQEKERLQEEVQSDLRKLVEYLDDFIDVKLTTELEELKEDLEEARKYHFGQKIFESFVDEFMRSSYFKNDELVREYAETKQALNEALETAAEMSKKYEELLREKEIDRLTNSLSGTAKRMMRTILESSHVPVENLKDAYENFLTEVLERNSKQEMEKSSEVLNEGEEIISETASIVGAPEKETPRKKDSLVSKELDKIVALAGIKE